jgi:serine/threonine-protein kinase
MEFLEGDSLAGRRRKGRIEWPDAISIWLQLASAIEAAHEQGIVHRDLKPDNVFLCTSREETFVKVLDFGIAKLMGGRTAGPAMVKTSTGVPIGTPTYMAPEQATGGQIDHRTDLYAFGLILYETISGRPPFTGANLIEVLTQHLNAAPPPLASHARIDAALDQLVMRLLAKEPAQRGESMATVRAELVRLRNRGSQEGPLYTPLDAQPKTTTPIRRWPLAAAAGAAAVISAVGVALSARHRPPPPAHETVAAAVAARPVEAPKPALAPPLLGTVIVNANVSTAQAFVDTSASEHSSQAVAVGGPQLRVAVPPGVDRVLRLEAPGYQPALLPLKLAPGEERTTTMTLTAVPLPTPTAVPPSPPRGPSGSHHGTHHGAAAARAPSVVTAPAQTAAPPAKPAPKPDRGGMMDPF